MKVDEVKLGRTDRDKMEAIQSLLGREVFVKDFHEEWCHGTILNDGYDNQVYQMMVRDGRGERQLHYNDLRQLLVVRR